MKKFVKLEDFIKLTENYPNKPYIFCSRKIPEILMLFVNNKLIRLDGRYFGEELEGVTIKDFFKNIKSSYLILFEKQDVEFLKNVLNDIEK